MCMAIRIVIVVVACLQLTGWAFAQDLPRSDNQAFQSAMAKAVRNAANRFLPSVVNVEIIGAVGLTKGEVEQDAPTSGLIIDTAGYVLASSIVVRRPSATILVVLPDGSRHAAKVVARDHRRNLVLLKVETDKELQAVELPSEFATKIGATTIAVGRYGSNVVPLVSRGVLSAVDRLDGIALQTDARVSPSFYGGPLIDLRGNLLGVLIPGVAPGGAPDETSWYDSGIAFAIPADVIRKKLERLKSGEDISRGLMGVVPKTRDPLQEGTELAAVRTRSPAETAGLKPGDKITSLDGRPVKRFQQIKQILGRFDAGETIALEYERKGTSKVVDIELIDSIPPLTPQRLGLILAEAGTDEQDSDDDVDTTQIVVGEVLPNGPSDGTLESGDVILSINGSQVDEIQTARRMMISAEPEKEVRLIVRREEAEKEVKIQTKNTAGELAITWPTAWEKTSEKEWKLESLKLPDIDNEGAIVFPADDEELGNLGLLVWLMKPGDKNAKEALNAWANLAREHGVVVCAVAASGDARWSPKEIDVASRFAKAALKKAAISESAVAVAAPGILSNDNVGAADSMAMAVAISASETFFGVAVSNETRPPAVRLRENEPDSSLEILLPIGSRNDLPTWGAALEKVGYPILMGNKLDSGRLLQWTRLLQSI